jgi:hypothetical protein
VYTIALGAVDEMSAETLLTVLAGVWIEAHVVGAYELIIMRCKDYSALMAAFFAPPANFKDNRRCELIVKIV